MDPQYAYQTAPANFMPMMAGGGLADAAQQLQGQGRGGDSMLVHMTPGEVKGLQALAMSQGGSLTINPTTGLPEASVLKALLPMIAGFALGPAGFGLMSATGAGLTVGALTGIATKSLKKGLMAGLGAYGGAGLGQGLVSAATPATDVATQVTAAPTSAFEMAQSNLGPGAEFATKESVIQNAIQSPAYQQALTSPTLAGSPALDAMTAADVAQAKVLPGQIITTTPSVAPTGLDAAKSGLTNVFKTGPEGTAARAAFGKATPFGTMAAAAAPIASSVMEPPKGPTPSEAYIRPYEFAWNPQEAAYNPAPTPGDTSERHYFSPTFTPMPIYRAAEGGQVDPFDEMTEDGGYNQGGLSALAKKRKSLAGDKLYKFAQDRRDSSMEAGIDQNFAAGGLGAALPPRFLSGGGDGMSDSIKANIDGKQEARLADGEFVVPADVVSHLGNGSSKAGAKKLYAMMDKIRKARTGSKRQAPEVNAAKYMPA
jgi:hypothetical protein